MVGPTSSGKTSLGVDLALLLNGEVISADSRQVYTGFNLITGKVTEEEMRGVPHHLLDVADPQIPFSADDFKRLAQTALDEITIRGKLPIIVGGTGYYIDALLERKTMPEVAPNHALREELADMSAEELFILLVKKDPIRASTIEPHHKRRLIRALEIAKALGQSPIPKKHEASEDVLWIGLKPNEEILAGRIHSRLVERFSAGMLEEAKHLHEGGLSLERMRELGLELRALADMIEDGVLQEETIERLDRETRRYAKRQMRWFKNNKEILWFENAQEALSAVKTFF